MCDSSRTTRPQLIQMPDSNVSAIEERIFTVRGVRVILDSHLARLYGVSTKRLNEQYRRNAKRFPEDFAFQLTREETAALRSQNAAESMLPISLRSQIATLKPGRGRHRKYRPYVFTEHGALQAANVLNSADAVRMSVFVIRAFVKMREQLATNAAILKRLAEIDKTLLVHDSALHDLYRKFLPLLAPAPPSPRKQIGFHP
jgi:hypothetical protein